jgi:hypothetical protein
MIVFKYKGQDIKLTELHLYLVGDITFSLIIFIWYILYRFEIFTYFSPFFALVLTLLQNIILLSYLIIKRKININDTIKYIIILLIIKIIPILSFYPKKAVIHLRDIFFILYLYAFYIIFILILIKIFNFEYDIKKVITADFSGENYDKTPQTKIYDLTYDGLITVLFSNNNSN